MDTDESLYRRVRQGDLTAFDLLYARYQRELYRYIYRYLGNRQESEEVFQEAFLEVLESREIAFSAGSFRGWLYRIAGNRCLNRLRSRRRNETAAQALPMERQYVEGAESEYADRELEHLLRRTVENLPPTLQEIYHLRAENRSYQEIAEVQGVPLGTVKSRIHEMVNVLKEGMKACFAKT